MTGALIFEIDTTNLSTPLGVDIQSLVDVAFPGMTLQTAIFASIQKKTDLKSIVVMTVVLV